MTNTFGKTPAALVLEKLLVDDDKNRRKLSTLYGSFGRTLNELSKIDSRIGIGLAKTVTANYILRSEDFPTDIETFFANVISAKYKLWLKEQNAIKPYTQRDRK